MSVCLIKSAYQVAINSLVLPIDVAFVEMKHRIVLEISKYNKLFTPNFKDYWILKQQVFGYGESAMKSYSDMGYILRLLKIHAYETLAARQLITDSSKYAKAPPESEIK